MIRPEYKEYYMYLESLRRSGVVNMFGAGIYLETDFGLSHTDARHILAMWMKDYDEEDYNK